MAKERPSRKIVLTGGGTGGHVYPAITTAKELRTRAQAEGFEVELLYVGSPDGQERTAAEAEDIPFRAVAVGKLRRSKTLAGLLSLKNLKDLFRLPIGIAQAWWILAKHKPDVVFGTGGYVAVPCVIGAWLARRKVVLHEQTMHLGLANRISARFADVIALGWEATLKSLPPKAQAKAIVTGNPLRPEIFDGDPLRLEAAFGFQEHDRNLPTIYVTGGSQGSQQINQALLKALPELLGRCKILHQHGGHGINASFADDARQALDDLPSELRRRYVATPFVGPEIADVYAAADLLIGRSGAGTVAETLALGIPAIFIPLTPTHGDEQVKNARLSERLGRATVLLGEQFNGQTLASTVLGLIEDPQRLAKMRGQDEPNPNLQARQKIVDLLLQRSGGV